MLNKGISNGEYCINVNIDHNLIVGCGLGIGAKSGAQVIADHNTLYYNRMGVNSYDHLNQIWGPGHLTVTNSIITGSDTTKNVDPTAYLSISYSLSADTLLTGIGNIMGDPMFVSAIQTRFPTHFNTGDYHLMPLSAAIDKGDSTFALDPDGSITDIGRYYLNQNTSVQKLNHNLEMDLIYPNPSNGKFILKMTPDYKIHRLVVLNDLGKIIRENEFFGGGTRYQIDLSAQSAGVYYLQLFSGTNTATKKVIVY